MAGRFPCAALVASVFCSVAWAAEKPPQPLPSAELLEFLAEFETSRGKTVDPLQFGGTQGKKPKERASTPKAVQEQPEPVRTKGEKP